MRTDGDDDYLDEDIIIPHLRWALVSVISPATVNAAPDFKWDMRMLKIRYACETEEQADKKAEYFHKIDSYHHVMKMRIGRWGAFDDRDEFAEEINFGDERMNSMMKAFKEQQQKADEYEAERRINAKKNAVKHQKMLEERRKKKDRKRVKKINSTTDQIVSNELVSENIIAMQGLSADELQAKLLELEKPITPSELIENGIVKNTDEESDVEDIVMPNIDELKTKVENQEQTLEKINLEYIRVQEQLARLRK